MEPLTPKAAALAMLNGERLVDNKSWYTTYRWKEADKCFIKDDGFYIDNYEPLTDFSGLYRKSIPGAQGENTEKNKRTGDTKSKANNT